MARHLDELGAGRGDQLARRVRDPVVPRQIARVVVRDACACERGTQGEPALCRQVGEQLGVVVDGLVEPVVRIVVAQRVERMGIGGEDRL